MMTIRLSKEIISFLLLVSVFIVTPVAVFADDKDVADETTPVQILPIAENDPLAVVKEGFFNKVEKGRVHLKDMKTYRKSSYRLEEDYLLFHEDKVINLYDIPPASIIKVIMIEGQVREIIVLQRSS